jgi:hypothetical protein
MKWKSQKRLVDLMLSAYVDWREACSEVDAAYRAWGRGTGPNADVAFTLYATALEQEERAASLYATLVGDVRQTVCAAEMAAAA